ncbi:MAG: hypothetical protein ACRCTQ_02870 [Brevinemataceae bacterium]
MSKFSFSNLLSVSWNLIKAHPAPVLGFYCLYFSVLIALAVFQQSGSMGASILFNVFSFLGQAVFFVFYMGMLFNIADGRPIDDFQNGWAKFGRVLLILLLLTLGILVIFSLALIPFFVYIAVMQIPVLKLLSLPVLLVYIIGVFLFVCSIYLRLYFGLYIVVDQNKDILSSLELSWRITKGKVLRIWLLMFVQVGLIICGALCLLAGLFVAIPLCSVMTMFFYRGLLDESSVAIDNKEVAVDIQVSDSNIRKS